MTAQRGGRVTPTDVEHGALLRRAVWSAASRTSTTGTSRDQTVLASIKANHPRAFQLFGPNVVTALLRTPAPGRCTWDAFRAHCAVGGKPLPRPTPGLFAALGSMCAACRSAFDRVESAEAERKHVGEVLDAGLNLAAAGRLRTSAEVRRHAAAIKRLQETPPPMAATGFLWAAGPEPPEVTAALTAAARRQPPDPAYYRPRPIRWPADARRPR